MSFSSWLAVRPAKKPQSRKSRLRSRPSVEMLEDRTLLAAATATTLATLPNPSVFGQTVGLAATVTPASPATGLTSGTVSFYANGTAIGTGTLAPSVTDFPVLAPESNAHGITSGPDGNLWCAESGTNRICRMTTSGTATEFTVTDGSSPYDITSGPDGNLWFTEYYGVSVSHIGRITPTGTLTEFPLPTPASGPLGIVTGPDGNLWFTEYDANKIGRITTSGTVTEFALSTAGSYPWNIAKGPDGNLWFTEHTTNRIGRITTSGTITEFAVPTLNSQPLGIAAGPDGNLWFTESSGNNIGRITTSGTITEFTLPTASSPWDIAQGPDGNMWFTEKGIGWITPSGTITEMPTSAYEDFKTGITKDPDGNIWFVENTANKIGRANLSLHTALLFTNSLPTGTDSMTATYNGDANFSTSTAAPVSQTVNKANTSTTVSSGLNPSVYGQAVTFTASVAAVAPGAGTPTGTATFLDGTTTLGAVSLSGGSATLKIASLAAAAHAITVSYSGDSNFVASTLAALTQTVNKSSTSTTVTSSLNPSVSGQAVTLTATINAVAPGSGTPTGTATFYDGRNILGTSPLSGGIAKLTTSTLSGGNNKITVTYNGDSNFLSSTSPIFTQTVKNRASATTLAPLASSLLSTEPQAPSAAPAPGPVAGSGPPAYPSVVLTVAGASPPEAAKATDAVFAASHAAANDEGAWLFALLSPVWMRCDVYG